jgi:hypothetical protein
MCLLVTGRFSTVLSVYLQENVMIVLTTVRVKKRHMVYCFMLRSSCQPDIKEYRHQNNGHAKRLHEVNPFFQHDRNANQG